MAKNDGTWVPNTPKTDDEMISDIVSNADIPASTMSWQLPNTASDLYQSTAQMQQPSLKVVSDTSDAAAVKGIMAKTNTNTFTGSPSEGGIPGGSASSSGLNDVPLTIKRFDRTPVALGTGGTTKFPDDLSEKRYVNIQIYNTIQNDPNKFIAGGAGIVVETAIGFFNGIGKGGGVIDSAISAGKSAIESGKQLWNSATASKIGAKFNKSMANFKDVGNPSVGGNGEPVYMDEIWLPLPNDISESLNHNWIEGKGALDTITETASDILSSIGIGGSGGLEGGGGGSAIKSLVSPITGASNLASKMTGTQALTYNENKLIQYTDTEFRTIDLKWTLVPNNKGENATLQSIFVKLKAYSSPQSVSGKLLLRAPFFCRLKFYNPTLNDALQFDECVMTSITLNYTATGQMETFNDDMPKVMEMNMTFKDREPKTLQNWAKAQEY